jgi:phage N-6-adenine-methyltransferase
MQPQRFVRAVTKNCRRSIGKSAENFKEQALEMKKVTIDAMTSSKNENFETPQAYFDELNDKYNFVLDLAANENNYKVSRYLTDIFDPVQLEGLNLQCGNAVYMNPPYGRNKTGRFIERAIEIANKYGFTLVMLLPARTDTRWFNLIWDRELKQPKSFFSVDFIQGRKCFELNGKPILDKKGKKSGALFPSMLVTYKRNFIS